MAGWGGAIDRIGGIIDGLFGLSPEQKKIKIRNKIDELEQEKKKVLNEPASINNSKRITAINDQLDRLRKQTGND